MLGLPESSGYPIEAFTCYNVHFRVLGLGDSVMATHVALDHDIGVRIPVPQPFLELSDPDQRGSVRLNFREIVSSLTRKGSER